MSDETTVQDPALPATTPQPQESEASQLLSGLGVLETVKVRLTVEVGRTEITIQDLLKQKEGSVARDEPAGR